MANNKKRKKASGHNASGEIKAQDALLCPDKREKTKRILLHIAFGIIFLIASVIFSVAVWYDLTFDISFSDLLFTMLSPLGGTGESTISQILASCLPAVILLMVVYIVSAILLFERTKLKDLLRQIGALVCSAALLLSVIYALFAFRIPEYLANSSEVSELYEKEYIDPDTVKITDKDSNAQNLIYIFVESLETTYASQAVGGAQESSNYIPLLTAYAEDNNNVSFSDGDALGGFHSIAGTGWTMGALMGMTSGVPFSLAVFGENSNNSQGKDGTFVNGLTAIGDILADKGYAQEFLCGSKASFAGRDTYFTVHGGYDIFDYNTAINEGYIDEDYYVWWGFEDEILFDIARDEVTALADSDKPFNFTMLTVDTHHVGGYRCNVCPDEYDTRLENVISCTDRQVYEFVEWCKSQDFYENTTIVIVGDHPRMDTQLVSGVDFYDRTIYNCIINSVVKPYSSTKNRVCTSLDMFPTTLAAMGFEIEGERLGLGTNLFSPIPTLPEKHGTGRIGHDWFDDEVSKESNYYRENFVNKKD